jgi:hypothetical protein
MVIRSYGRGPSNKTALGEIPTPTERRQDMSVFDSALEAIGSSTLIVLAAVIVIVGLLELREHLRERRRTVRVSPQDRGRRRMREQCGS